MNRIEEIRQGLNKLLSNLEDCKERRDTYHHLLGVSQFCALIAKKRQNDAELATIAGLLHDVYRLKTLESFEHDKLSAKDAQEMVSHQGIMNEEEMAAICEAIYHHSDKQNIHSELAEIVKDADVLQHHLFDVNQPVLQQEKERYEKLKIEFGLD